jgi:hypothetical protein
VFRFAGSSVLKGVNFGRPYPLISACFEAGADNSTLASSRRYSIDSGSIRLSPEEIIDLALQFYKARKD